MADRIRPSVSEAREHSERALCGIGYDAEVGSNGLRRLRQLLRTVRDWTLTDTPIFTDHSAFDAYMLSAESAGSGCSV
jgi:hypothetical protein